MTNIFDYYDDKTYLAHHGIKGQKWGVRRYQNPDGSFTEIGKERYGRDTERKEKKINDTYSKLNEANNNYYTYPSKKSEKKANKAAVRLVKENNKIGKKYNMAYDQDNDRVVLSRKSKEQIKYDTIISKPKNIIKTNNRAAEYLNGPNGELAKLNAKWEKIFNDEGYSLNYSASPKYSEYVKEGQALINNYKQIALEELFGKRPD